MKIEQIVLVLLQSRVVQYIVGAIILWLLLRFISKELKELMAFKPFNDALLAKAKQVK